MRREPAFVYRLTERRKADREQMAREVEALAALMGWQSSRCELRITVVGPHGLACSIEFERQPAVTDHYCMPWHFNLTNAKEDGYKRLSKQFGRFQGSEVNSYHGRKCTAFAGGIDELLDKLLVAMEMANGTSAYGSAFEEEK
jgi:hypothetical protein